MELAEDVQRLFAAAVIARLRGRLTDVGKDKRAGWNAMQTFITAQTTALTLKGKTIDPAYDAYDYFRYLLDTLWEDKDRTNWKELAEEYKFNADEVEALTALPR